MNANIPSPLEYCNDTASSPLKYTQGPNLAVFNAATDVVTTRMEFSNVLIRIFVMVV